MEAEMRKVVDLTGQRFARLLVLGQVPKPIHLKKKVSCWECQCDCGEIRIVTSSNLKSGNSKSCGCLNEENKKQLTNNLVGIKFGRLTVIQRAASKNNKKVLWECICDCGNIKIVASEHLTNKHTQSCGCKRSIDGLFYLNSDKPKISSAKIIFHQYNDGDLTFDEFYYLINQNCSYCNLSPNNSNYFNSFKLEKSSQFALTHGLLKYNGLDRIDSNQSHLIKNVIPCCFICNCAKNSNSLSNFIDKILKLNTKPQLITILDRQFLSKKANDLLDLNLDFKNKRSSGYKELAKLFPFYCQKNNRLKVLTIKGYIKSNASERYLIFNLSIQETIALLISPCVYCNNQANFTNGDFNGIDRIDSSIGYQPNNCVSCCKWCNWGKSDLSYEDWIIWINRIKNNIISFDLENFPWLFDNNHLKNNLNKR